MGRGRLGGKWSIEDFSSFFIAHRSSFISYASKLLGNRQAGEEVVQDSLLRVLLASPELTEEKQVLSYFYRTIENLCRDHFRIAQKSPRLILIDEAVSEIDYVYAQQADHSDELVAADDAAIIREAISLLSPAERSIH